MKNEDALSWADATSLVIHQLLEQYRSSFQVKEGEKNEEKAVECKIDTDDGMRDTYSVVDMFGVAN